MICFALQGIPGALLKGKAAVISMGRFVACQAGGSCSESRSTA
jgi:hypothetical protein